MTMMITTIEEQVMDACSFFCVFQPDGNVREKHLMKSRACRFLWKPRGIFLVMDKEQQMRAPVYEALEKLKKRRVVPFDVPGHKRGRGNPELVELLGEKCVSLDVNSMKPLDNLCHPVSVIKEAEELAAEAFRADHAFFMVGGTTSSVQGLSLIHI